MKGERLGEFEEIVMLALRALSSEVSSASIQDLLRRDAGRRASLGAIYAALDRLERKGWVRSWLGEPTRRRGGRRRRHYRITIDGEGALEHSRRVRERLWERGVAVSGESRGR